MIKIYCQIDNIDFVENFLQTLIENGITKKLEFLYINLKILNLYLKELNLI